MGKKRENIHHIIPRARNGSNNEKNLVRMEMYKHNGLHQLFYIDLPHEQIEKILSISSTALIEQFKNDIKEVLEKHRDNYYDRDVFK